MINLVYDISLNTSTWQIRIMATDKVFHVEESFMRLFNQHTIDIFIHAIRIVR